MRGSILENVGIRKSFIIAIIAKNTPPSIPQILSDDEEEEEDEKRTEGGITLVVRGGAAG